MTGITKEPYGKTKDGREVFMFTLTAGPVTVRVLNFGCVVKDILVPDKHGNIVDICIGYDCLADYETNAAFLGCITGRVSNRIGAGSFTLDGVRVEVSKNDPLGNNICHGGFLGLSRRYFDWAVDGSRLVLTYVDVDGAEGFPGDVNITVTYELTEKDGLMMNYKATTNKPTPVDISNHTMVNLAGHNTGSIDDHLVMVNSDTIIEFDDKFIPTGQFVSVEGSPDDLRQPTRLGDILNKMPHGDGMHAAKVLPGNSGEKKFVARAEHPASGRYLEVHSTAPAMVEYGCYYLDLLMKGTKGKDGAVYQRNAGVLFMPQGYPDAVNQPSFPSCVLRPGQTYEHTSWYKFGVTC